MYYRNPPHLVLLLTLWACGVYWHTPAIGQHGEHQRQAEQYLEQTTRQLKRDALSGEKMNIRRYIFSSHIIEATAIWGAKNQLLFPGDEGITHINDSVILKDRYRLEKLLATANPTAWNSRDIQAEQLFYCQRDAVSICLLINTTELISETKLPRDELFAELFPTRKQVFFWWGYALFVLLVSLSLILWHRLRTQSNQPATQILENTTFTIGDALIDPLQKRASRHDLCVDLSDRDVILLKYFCLHPNEVLSKNTLYDIGWSRDFVASSRALEQHIINLRRKLDPERQYTHLIETVHGQGYRYPADSF